MPSVTVPVVFGNGYVLSTDNVLVFGDAEPTNRFFTQKGFKKADSFETFVGVANEPRVINSFRGSGPSPVELERPADPLPDIVADPLTIDRTTTEWTGTYFPRASPFPLQGPPRYTSPTGTIAFPAEDDYLQMYSCEVRFREAPFYYPGNIAYSWTWLARLWGPGFMLTVKRDVANRGIDTAPHEFSGTAWGTYQGDPVSAPSLGVPLNVVGSAATLEKLEFVIRGASYFAQLTPRTYGPNNTLYYDVHFEHDFSSSTSGSPLKIRVTDSYGFRSGWVTVYLPPVPIIEFDESASPLVVADASRSYSPTGRIVSYKFTPASGTIPAVEQTTPVVELDYTNYQDQRDQDLSTGLSLQIISDPEYAFASSEPSPFYDWRPLRLASVRLLRQFPPAILDDGRGVTYTATRSREGFENTARLEINRYTGGSDTKETVMRLPLGGFDFPPGYPQLIRTGEDGTIWLVTFAYQNGGATLSLTRNSFETITGMSTIPFPPAQYSRTAVCGLSFGAIAAAAIRKSDKRLFFTFTLNGTNWSPLEDTGIVAETSNPRLSMTEESSSGQSAIRLTDGVDFNYRRTNFESSFEAY